MPPALSLRRPITDLLGLIPDAALLGQRLPAIRKCTDDIWSVGDGDLFVCVNDAEFDGHDVAIHAAKRGAAALVVEHYLPCDLPQILTTDARVAHASLCHALAGDPSRSLKVIGVTGTLGKTCVSTLIASVLEAGGRGVIRANDLAIVGSDTVERSWGAKGSPERLAAWLADGVASRATHAVVELHSRGLSQRRYSGLHLDSLVITNVRREHLDFHNTLANYRKAKARALSLLDVDGAMVTSADDPGAMALATRWHGPLLTVSLGERAEITAQVVERCTSEQTFLLYSGGDTAVVRTAITGDTHVENCLLAAALGLIHAVDLPEIVKGLEAVECIPGRLERIERGQDYSIFLEQASTPAGLSQAIRTLRGVVGGRLLCALDTDHADTLQQAAALHAAAKEECDLLFASGHSLPPVRLASQSTHVCKSRFFGDRRAAIAQALSNAQPGDCVLIAGAIDETDPLDPCSAESSQTGIRLLKAA